MQSNGRASKSGISVLRLVILVVFFCVACAGFVIRLLYLQIGDGDELETMVNTKNYKTAVISAARGEIYDLYGNKLVSNVPQFNVEINRTTLANGASVDVLSSFIDLLEKYDTEIPDHCPLTQDAPYMLDPDYIFDAEQSRAFEKFLKLNEKEKSDLTGTDFYDYLVNRYDISEELAPTRKGRKIAAVRYDMEVNDFSSTLPYVLLEDVDETLKTVISENLHTLHGIEISKSYSRTYNMDSTLCHVLGRIGPIFATEAEEYIEQKGYPYNALIGKDGAEAVFEEDLRGIDGIARVELDSDNNVVGYEVTKQPKEGYSVRLTIDAKLQKIVEDSLAEQIQKAVEYSALEGSVHSGEDSKAGAAVVVDVHSGEIRALANYPLYNLNTFSEDFNVLKEDPASPLLNRATQGIYPPGSTFKIATAAAALDSGAIGYNTYIYDRGEYKKYAPTYTPRCWIYIRSGTTHGYVNVADALKVSCNYFFYSVADQMGVDTIVNYAQDFGLGVKTGIEIPESSGVLASPEYKESNGYVWNPGDTLQMAIGQSDNAFTPLQLALYMSTIVNGGNRYKATLFKSVDHYHTGVPVRENTPTILNTTQLSEETVNILKSAMRSVVDDQGGTAQGVFSGKSYARDIGGKTGTAQVSKGSDTVLFVGFAPYDDPEIAVAVVVENGYKSARAASVAAEVFDYYFENTAENRDTQGEKE